MSKLLYNSLLITVPIVLVNMIHINIIGFFFFFFLGVVGDVWLPSKKPAPFFSDGSVPY